MKVKVTVKTPRNQAETSMQTQRDGFLGFKAAKKIVEEKLISDSEFYWILEIEPKDLKSLTRNIAKGEMAIRKFYKTLFKVIDRCNKLQGKVSKGALWIKRQMIKRLRKLTGSDDGLINNLENMNEEQIGEFIYINDREAMGKLLAGELIKLEELQ